MEFCNWGTLKSEVSKRGWREGVGDKQTPKKSPKSSSEMCPLLLRGIGKRVQKRGLNLWHMKDFLVPTPSVRQPLFETSDESGCSMKRWSDKSDEFLWKRPLSKRGGSRTRFQTPFPQSSRTPAPLNWFARAIAEKCTTSMLKCHFLKCYLFHAPTTLLKVRVPFLSTIELREKIASRNSILCTSTVTGMNSFWIQSVMMSKGS